MMQNTFNPFAGMSMKNPFMEKEDLMSGHRKNLESLTDAAKMAAEVTKSVAQLQGQFVKQLFGDMQAWGKNLEELFSKEAKIENQASRMKDTFNQGMDHGMKLATIVRQGQKDIYDVFKKRMEENFSDFQNRGKEAMKTAAEMTGQKKHPKN
ncbi:MAG TPA: phasin family protein [Alphaproteobacteria bacterium]|nr:phasin family protein [Alphaproteobacteria bacterium]